MKAVPGRLLLLILAIVGAAGAGQAQPVPVRLGTATDGGGFRIYGDVLASTINESDPTLSVSPVPTRGSAENLPMLESGALDIALIQGTSAYEALMGVGRPRMDLRILSAMYPSPGVFAVRGDSAHRSLESLKGQPVVFGAEGSGLVTMARYALDGLGLDMGRDFDAVLVTRAADSPRKVIAGEAAALWGAGAGWPGFATVAASPHGARFIGFTPQQVERIRGKHSFLQPMRLPARSYEGQAEAIDTVGSWNLILTRKDLPDDLAYRLIRTIDAAGPTLASRLDQAAETTPANTARAAPERSMLHPGVARYLREAGLLPAPG